MTIRDDGETIGLFEPLMVTDQSSMIWLSNWLSTLPPFAVAFLPLPLLPWLI